MVLLGLGHLHVDREGCVVEERGHLDAVVQLSAGNRLVEANFQMHVFVGHVVQVHAPNVGGGGLELNRDRDRDGSSVNAGGFHQLGGPTPGGWKGFSQVKANSIGADGGPHSFERRNKLEQGLDHQLLDLGLGIDRFREVEVQHIPSGGNRPGKALGQHNVGWRRGFGLKALLGKPQTCRSGEDVPAENVQDRKQCDQASGLASVHASLLGRIRMLRIRYGLYRKNRRFVLGSPKFVR